MLRLEWGHVQKVWSHGYGGNAADSNLHGKMGKKCGNSISQPLPKPNFEQIRTRAFKVGPNRRESRH